MRAATTFALVLTLALVVACGNDETRTAANEPAAAPAPAASQANLTPEQLGELGAQLRKDPARANELLTQRGLTRQSFEKAIRDVTESPDASKRYAEAYRKASA